MRRPGASGSGLRASGAATETARGDDALVDPSELEDIELVVLTRMKEHAAGTHTSVFHGEGFDFVGLRDWQPGDRPSAIDWAQSTITNFSPIVTREFEHESTATVMIVADTSASTRYGTRGTSIARVVARAVATLGFAGAFFQDHVGLVTLDGQTAELGVPPRVGKTHVVHCLTAYQARVAPTSGTPPGSPARRGHLAGMLRRPSLVPVVSDFLWDDPKPRLHELAELAATHDVFLAMADAVFAFDLPLPSSGWLELHDAETGHTRLLTSHEVAQLTDRVQDWQDTVALEASRQGLEVVRLPPGAEHAALADFVGRRRLRRR